METITQEVECLYCGHYTTNVSMICDWLCMDMMIEDCGANNVMQLIGKETRI